MTFSLRFATLSCALLIASGAAAQTNSNTNATGEFSLQGKLSSTTGTPITNGTHSLAINVYSKTSGQVIYSETDNVATLDGIFNTMIGDNGANGSLKLDANTNYEIGVSVDGQAEMSPRIMLGDVPRSILANTALNANTALSANVAGRADSAMVATTATTALNANAVGGFTVAANGAATPNSIVTLNSQGRIASGLLDSTIVTSINGLRGNVTFQSGNGVNVTSNGNIISFGLTGNGGGSGSFSLPFTQSLNLGTGDAFSITNTLAGNAASFSNTGLGNALNVAANTGSALRATSAGLANGAATIDASSTLGSAISATTSANGNAALTLRNLSTAANASLLTAVNGAGSNVLNLTTTGLSLSGNAASSSDAVLSLRNTGNANGVLLAAANTAGNGVFSLATNGATTINSSASTALDVTASGTGATAAKFTGGLSLVGPVGTGTVTGGNLTTTINNSLVKTNSIIMLTVNSTSGLAVPIKLTNVSNGSFTVGLISAAALTGNLDFNYLIINQ